MSREDLQYVRMDLQHCAEWNTLNANEMLASLQNHGATFLAIATHQPAVEINDLIEEDGTPRSLYLQHPTLAVDANVAFWRSMYKPTNSADAWGTCRCYPDRKSLSLSQNVDPTDPARINPDIVALGMVNFLLFWNDRLQPQYGWIDEFGHNAPSEDSLRERTLDYLFWCNLFGPELKHAIGDEFFNAIPRGKVVDLDNGGVLYLATDSFLEWREENHPDILAHFQQKFPRIRAYRATFSPT